MPIPAASARKARGNAGGGVEHPGQFRRAAAPGRSAFSAATGAVGARGPYRPARRAPAPRSARAAGASGTIRAPRAASSRPASGSSVTTATSPHRRAGQRRGHGVLREGQREPGPQRVAGGVRRACSWPAPAASAARPGSTPHAAFASLLHASAIVACRAPGGSPRTRGAYGVLDRPAAWGDTCAAARTAAGQQVGRSKRKVSACPAAESASGTAWRRSSRNRRWWFCSSGTGAEWSTFRPTADSSPRSTTTRISTRSRYAHFQYNTGRVPRFLAKAGLFKGAFVGTMLRGTGQIPVYRETHRRAQTPSGPPSTPSSAASASPSTPRAPSPATPTCGRWPARPAPPGSPC